MLGFQGLQQVPEESQVLLQKPLLHPASLLSSPCSGTAAAQIQLQAPGGHHQPEVPVPSPWKLFFSRCFVLFFYFVANTFFLPTIFLKPNKTFSIVNMTATLLYVETDEGTCLS